MNKLVICFENVDTLEIPAENVKVAISDKIEERVMMREKITYCSKIAKESFCIIDKDYIKKSFCDFSDKTSQNENVETRLKSCDIVSFEYEILKDAEKSAETEKKEYYCVCDSKNEYHNNYVHFGYTKNGDLWIAIYKKESSEIKQLMENWDCLNECKC